MAERHRALSPSFREVDHHDGEADPRRPLPLRPGWGRWRRPTGDRVGHNDLEPIRSGGTAATTPGRAPRPRPLPATGTGGTSTPVPTPSLDSVTIQNTTGLALVVTVHLEVSQFQQPLITETIPAQGNSIVLFNFGTATNAFMTMDMSLADGGQTPPPFTNVSLSQPISGYNGALFSISLIRSLFQRHRPLIPGRRCDAGNRRLHELDGRSRRCERRSRLRLFNCLSSSFPCAGRQMSSRIGSRRSRRKWGRLVAS